MSSGPLLPVVCTTVELKDLADTLDFDTAGVEGTIYGFEITEDGYYKRVDITEARDGSERFNMEQLQNLSTSGSKEGLQYAILKKGPNKWSLTPLQPKIDWLIKYEFHSPYTFMGKDNIFKKTLNAGPLLVSLVPHFPNRGNVLLKAYKKHNYLIHKRDGVSDVKVAFEPRLEIGQSATIILDIIAHQPTQERVPLIPQVSLSWTDLDEDPRRIVIFMRKSSSDNKYTIMTSPQITATSLPVGASSILSHIKLDHFDLLAFYFSDQSFSDKQMEHLVSELEKE